MPYTVHQAKTHLSRLLKEAEAGKEVIVTRGSEPVAMIVPIRKPEAEQLPFRLMGAYAGKIRYDDDAFDPLTDEQLKELGWGWMVDAALHPPGDEPEQK
jgi:prevent-host-death family protein